MFRLGLRLALQGGKETVTRLLLTVAAVAIGVGLLLAVLAEFHAYQITSGRPSWESTSTMTSAMERGASSGPSTDLLWNYTESIYKGHFIERLGIAAMGSNAPMPPGITKLPGAGQFYASPGLDKLLHTVSYDELGARFPGKEIGIIGQKGLTGPSSLVAMVGYTPAQMHALPGTIKINQINIRPQTQGTTSIYKLAFGIGVLALLFPLVILINTATRLAAARREERYAAIRLVGGTPRQVAIIASVDSIVGALLGTALGTAVFLLLLPHLAHLSLSGASFFADYVTPTLGGYIGMFVVMPAAAALGALVSLHRVQISPLGVSRKTTPKPPGWWRVLPLLVGIPVFVVPLLTSQNQNTPVLIGFFLIMIGLVLGGSWLTMQIARVAARFSRGPASLLAARRLADNPKVAFRSVTGLVLAVFIGTVAAVVGQAFTAAQTPVKYASLNTVLRVSYTNADGGLSPGQSAQITRKLQALPGIHTIPLYTNPDFTIFRKTHPEDSPAQPPAAQVIRCSDLQQLHVLGTCTPGTTAVAVNAGNLLAGDNPINVYSALPIVKQNSSSSSVNFTDLSIAGLLVKTANPDALEKARTLLAAFGNESVLGQNAITAWQMGSLEPETFGEIVAIRNNDVNNMEKVVFGGVAITILIASCSLAVAVGGSLVERRRPFTLLRLSGSPAFVLYKVVVLESVLPLVAAAVVAAGVGLGVAVPTTQSLMASKTGLHVSAYPSHTYYLFMGAGLVIAMLVVSTTLPLLRRITKPDEVRFE